MSEFRRLEAARIARAVISGADPDLHWRDAGYSSPRNAARALVGARADRQLEDAAVVIVSAWLDGAQDARQPDEYPIVAARLALVKRPARAS